jgi:hypothetical protein
VRSDAALEHRVAVDLEVMRRDGRGQGRRPVCVLQISCAPHVTKFNAPPIAREVRPIHQRDADCDDQKPGDIGMACDDRLGAGPDLGRRLVTHTVSPRKDRRLRLMV